MRASNSLFKRNGCIPTQPTSISQKRKKDHSMKKFICFLLSTMLMVSLLSTSAFAMYSSSKAITYSDKYALSPNSLNTVGEGYNVYSKDCTNFVSQCLYEGGLTQDSQWKSTLTWQGNVPRRTDSTIWTVADDFKNYLISSGRSIKIGSWSLNGSPAPYRTFAYTNNSNNLTTTNQGRVVLFYDWYGRGKMNHSAFFVRNNGASTDSREATGDLINQHTNNQKHVLWRPDYRDTVNKETTRVYAFEITDLT